MPTLIRTLVFLIIASPAMAHGNEAHGSTYPWTFDPWIVVPLAVIVILFIVGVIRLTWRLTRPGMMTIRVLPYCGGMLALAGALPVEVGMYG